jgi:hypothetical protein
LSIDNAIYKSMGIAPSILDLFTQEAMLIANDTLEMPLFYIVHISDKSHNFNLQHFSYNFKFYFFLARMLVGTLQVVRHWPV